MCYSLHQPNSAVGGAIFREQQQGESLPPTTSSLYLIAAGGTRCYSATVWVAFTSVATVSSPSRSGVATVDCGCGIVGPAAAKADDVFEFGEEDVVPARGREGREGSGWDSRDGRILGGGWPGRLLEVHHLVAKEVRERPRNAFPVAAYLKNYTLYKILLIFNSYRLYLEHLIANYYLAKMHRIQLVDRR